jgi:hypothetical protein
VSGANQLLRTYRAIFATGPVVAISAPTDHLAIADAMQRRNELGTLISMVEYQDHHGGRERVVVVEL